MRRFFHSVASGYALLAANTVFVLLQIPLALHYLSREQFGLWALVLQLTGYLQLVDLGMSASVARHLIDHKDDRESGVYGSLIQTAGLVLLVQGAIVLLLGVGFAFAASRVLRIATEFDSQFKLLMSVQCGLLALTFPMKIFGHLLTAHQRTDIFNYCQIGLFVVNYAALWISLAYGSGVFSLVLANIAGSLFLVFASCIACAILRLYPSPNAWGRPSWLRFRELFAFGKDVFWIALGAQMINASQTIVVTRAMGLDTSGVWAIGTRAYTLVTQLVWRPFDFSYPALSEMVVRNERTWLLHRFKNLVILSSSLAVACAVMFALCNKAFVELWTHGKVIWSSQYDVLLSLWLIVLTLVHCHSGFVVISKRVRFMKYIYFIEGAAFLTVGSYAASRYGIAGLIVTSIIASLIFSCSYGIWRTANEFNLTVKEVALLWLIPSMRLLLLLGTLAGSIYWAAHFLSAGMQLFIYIITVGTAAIVLFARLGLTAELRQELLHRAPLRFGRWARLFPR